MIMPNKDLYSVVLLKPTSKQFFKTIIKINLYVFLQIKWQMSPVPRTYDPNYLKS